MTLLSGDRKISKAHGRISFRGLIDSLEADVIEAQVLASERGEEALCVSFGEVLSFLREIMAAEVKETPLKPLFLFGMNADEIHWRSHNAGLFVLPDYSQGALAARINSLRARVREVELVAVKVMGAEQMADKPRDDIIVALNRLSSALWWLFCSYVDQKRGQKNDPKNDQENILEKGPENGFLD